MDELYGRSLLERLPQRAPFRFVDAILELSDEHIVGRYRFPVDAEFYRGHFPGDPVTPGVLLLEAMAQVGVVALGLHLTSHRQATKAAAFRTLFTEAEVEFSALVRPGTTVTTTARKVYFRRDKLKVEAEMRLDDRTLVCSGALAGVGVVGP